MYRPGRPNFNSGPVAFKLAGMKRTRKRSEKARKRYRKTRGAKRAATKRKAVVKSRRRVRPRTGGDGDGQMLYSRLKRNYGSYKPMTLRNLNSRVKAYEDKIIFAFRHITPFTSKGGAKFLQNYDSIANAGYVTSFLPCHFYDITAVNNFINGTFYAAQPALEVRSITPNNPSAGFTNTVMGVIPAYDNTGTYTTTLTAEKIKAGGSGQQHAYSLNKSILKWADIKLICHGAANYPTKYDIAFVQFNRPRYTPHSVGTNGFDEANSAYKDIDEFYNYLIRPFNTSPLAVEGSSQFRNGIKVLHRINFTIQPRDVSDSGTVVPFKEIKIFRKFDRLCNYDWMNNPQVQKGGITSTAEYPTWYGSNSNHVYPTKRIYMMIRATAHKQLVDAEGNLPPADTWPDFWPSYDFNIRTCHTTV